MRAGWTDGGTACTRMLLHASSNLSTAVPDRTLASRCDKAGRRQETAAVVDIVRWRHELGASVSKLG